jgi:hypothetical protein
MRWGTDKKTKSFYRFSQNDEIISTEAENRKNRRLKNSLKIIYIYIL